MANDQSAQPCGCDLGCRPAHFCATHRDTPAPGWVGVDFDGVLVEWDPKYLPAHGPVIPAGVALLQRLLDEGVEVRIFTARVQPSPDEPAWWAAMAELEYTDPAIWLRDQVALIQVFCREQVGQVLPITAAKDYKMITCYDDRSVQMISNTGESLDARLSGIIESREQQILSLCGILGVEAEEHLEERIRTLQADYTALLQHGADAG